ncbi:MAG: transcriptional regulator NrdR [Fimbriimonadaceae bacterium]
MICPKCGCEDLKVLDSRRAREGTAIRRRRECERCEWRFTTYECFERADLTVIKRDGRREPFNRSKLHFGFATACRKRPVTVEQIDDLVDSVERLLTQQFDAEVSSETIGEKALELLSQVDQVAYIRFASVYQEFRSAEDFQHLLQTGTAEAAWNPPSPRDVETRILAST